MLWPMTVKVPPPALVRSELSLSPPPPLEQVPGFAQTFDRRGQRALVQHHAGWAGKFVAEVEGDGTLRLLCKTGLTTFAAWLDDEHVMISAGIDTWVGRITPKDFTLVSGVTGLSGPITPLHDDMIAIGLPDASGLRLLAFRGGRLRLYRGNVKLPAGAAQIDRALMIHEGRVFAVGTDNLELTGGSLAADWDPEADWDKALKKLVKSSDTPIVATEARAPVAESESDGSLWRFDGDDAAVLVGDRWCVLALPNGLSGSHYVELPDPERRFLVRRLVHGALDLDKGVAWLVTAGLELVRARLDTGASEVIANLSPVYPEDQTVGVFPLTDGRVVVLGRQHLAIIDPTAGAEPWGRALGLTVCSALPLGGPLIAHASVWPSQNKNGLPVARLSLVEIGRFPRDWLSWELPMYAPTLRFDGRTLTAEDGHRALAFDLEAALAWFPNFAGRDDVSALPPKGS